MLSRVWLSATPWTVAHQAPLSMEFSRQEYWSRLPYPPPGDFPNPKMESTFPASPVLAGRFFTSELLGKPPFFNIHSYVIRFLASDSRCIFEVISKCKENIHSSLRYCVTLLYSYTVIRVILCCFTVVLGERGENIQHLQLYDSDFLFSSYSCFVWV